MALRYLLDEHLRGTFGKVIRRHNLVSEMPLDVVRIGDVDDLPLGSPDPQVLRWAEREDRILVTQDRRSMGRHLMAHLASGHHCPGIFMLRPGASYRGAVEFLMLAAYASSAGEWRDQIHFVA